MAAASVSDNPATSLYSPQAPGHDTASWPAMNDVSAPMCAGALFVHGVANQRPILPILVAAVRVEELVLDVVVVSRDDRGRILPRALAMARQDSRDSTPHDIDDIERRFAIGSEWPPSVSTCLPRTPVSTAALKLPVGIAVADIVRVEKKGCRRRDGTNGGSDEFDKIHDPGIDHL
jgi:hypothetical protein